MPDSETVISPRIRARRQAIVDEALEHAATVLASDGVGAVTVSEIARRMGMRAPSLYKYFPSLHAIYDALFLHGYREISAAMDTAVRDTQPGLERILVASRAILRWSYDNTGLAQLMFWRPVPGFQPSSEAFQPSQAMWQRFRDDLATAVRLGALDATADSDEGLRLLTIVIAGLFSQQMANDPGSSFDEGAFTSLTDQALGMFVRDHSARILKGTS
jgi:AcrR family transcriptional regulator